MQAQQRFFASAGLLPLLRSITLDHLWVASIIAVIWLFISVTPLPPNDLWWHMAAGRAMVEEGAWLTTNRWAYTLPADAPYTYQSWLSEVLLYEVWHLGGVPLLSLARTLAVTLSYSLLAWHAWRRTGGNGKAVALAVLLAVLVGWNNWTLRPQTLALLPAAAFVVVLGEYLAGRLAARWLVALPVLMSLWVNLHGSFAVGIGLIALAWFGVALSRLRGHRAPDTPLLPLTYAALATAAAAVVHPLGVDILGYVRRMLTDPPSQDMIIEWQPPTNDLNLMSGGFWFFVLLFALAALMAASPRRPSATDLLWYCALGWLTVGGIRYAIWFGLLLLPLLATQLAALFKPKAPVPSSPVFTSGYALVLGAMMVAVLPWFAPGRYLGPGARHLFAHAGPDHMLVSSATPLVATEWLAQHPIEGRFWTDMSYSSYTIWRLPAKQVFADLRIDMFPLSIWEEYGAIARGEEPGIAMLDKWQISHMLLDTVFQADLDARLQTTPGWCEVYRDPRAVIFARCP